MITIFREIALKQIVTQKSKDIALKQLHDQLTELMAEIEAYEEEKTRMLTGFALRGGEGGQMENLRRQLDGESSRFFVRKDELMRQIGEVQNLREGEEIPAGSVEGPRVLQVGDDFAALAKAEIVLKDGMVAEIRDGA
ncbi:MAG: YlqD family protein [Gracilibacteraceae bacterium]|nr:YlqD family protein [Gracilibacteraceae bacterium]